MEEEEGGIRLSKRFSDKGKEGEVDYKTKAGTAWSHNFLNQKPWHPLSYPNQRRKWIAEQTHAQKERRAEEVAREYAQEQEFFRQTALVSKKEKEKMEMMKAVSFMYVRPPGYNPESAKAAEVADERKQQEQDGPAPETSAEVPSTSMMVDSVPSGGEKRKQRPKDVFGRALPTEEQFEVLKNAPRLETGVAARSKPFGIEIRNVKCLRCGNFGHQSGDRECPLKDAMMPNEESRLKRDDPLTAILAQTDNSEPLKWELKQKPGMSPPRGGFNLDDPNQQIVADEIFDEYGGFLGGENIPELLTNFSSKPRKKSSKSKHKSLPTSILSDSQENGPFSVDEESKRSRKRKHRRSSMDTRLSDQEEDGDGSSSDDGRKRKSKKKKHKRNKQKAAESTSSENPDNGSSSDDGRKCKSKKKKHKRTKQKAAESTSSEDSDHDRHLKGSSRSRECHSRSSDRSDGELRSRQHRRPHEHHRHRNHHHRHRRHRHHHND